MKSYLRNHDFEDIPEEFLLPEKLYTQLLQAKDNLDELSDFATKISEDIRSFGPDYGRMLLQLKGHNLESVTSERIISKVYMDNGTGFSESLSLEKAISCYEKSVTFYLDEINNLKKVRFDICEDYCCVDFFKAYSEDMNGQKRKWNCSSPPL